MARGQKVERLFKPWRLDLLIFRNAFDLRCAQGHGLKSRSTFQPSDNTELVLRRPTNRQPDSFPGQ